MKANELFIDAHVEVFGRNRKIKSIVAKDTGVEVSFYGGNTVIVSLDMLRPIPLTPEILEKNGFVYNESPLVQSWEQFGLSLYLGGDGYRINCGQNVAMVIDSVHQLQHALKLCGIDKEIVV